MAKDAQNFTGYVRAHQQPFDLYGVDDAGNIQKLLTVTAAIVETAMISETDLAAQVCRVSGEITHWGVMESRARKSWQRGEMEYRVWREVLTAKLLAPPVDPAKAKEWKRPTEAMIEANYRSQPEYLVHQRRLHDLEESFNAAHAVLEGFRAKKEMLKATVKRSNEDGAPMLSV